MLCYYYNHFMLSAWSLPIVLNDRHGRIDGTLLILKRGNWPHRTCANLQMRCKLASKTGYNTAQSTVHSAWNIIAFCVIHRCLYQANHNNGLGSSVYVPRRTNIRLIWLDSNGLHNLRDCWDATTIGMSYVPIRQVMSQWKAWCPGPLSC